MPPDRPSGLLVDLSELAGFRPQRDHHALALVPHPAALSGCIPPPVVAPGKSRLPTPFASSLPPPPPVLLPARIPILPGSGAADMRSGGLSNRGSHRLSLAWTAPRAWWWRFVRGVVPCMRPVYFTEGTLIHLQFAHHFAARLPPERRPGWYGHETLADGLAREGTGCPEAVALSHEVYAAWRTRGHDAAWMPLAVEHEFATTLGAVRCLLDPAALPQSDDNEPLASRIDLVLWIPDARAPGGGRVWALDFKTVGRTGRSGLYTWSDQGEYALRLQFLLQEAVMRAALAATGLEVGGILVHRVAKKPPFDADTNPVPAARGAWRDLPATLALLCRHERALQSVPDMPSCSATACFEGGRPCDYRPLCLAPDEDTMRRVLQSEYVEVQPA